MQTGAIYGFVRMLLKLIEDFKPEYIAAVFDSKGKTVRHQSFTEYKATRRETPNDLVAQIPYIKQIIKLLGIKILKMEGYEADDIIATVAKKAVSEGFDVIIVSPDKDMLQLVNSHIKVFNPVKEVLYDENKVLEDYHIKPSQFVDFLSMVGDNVDNVPGIKGVGPKTAQTLLNQFETLENIIENTQNLPEKYKKFFEGLDIDSIKKSKQLIELYQVPIEIEIESLKKEKADLVKLRELFTELGFKSLLNENKKEKKDKETKQKSLF